MTPEERAEKIYENCIDDEVLVPDTLAFIAAQIREAEKEAYRAAQHTSPGFNAGYREGRASMREEAAKVAEMTIAEDGTEQFNFHISKAIRAIGAEGTR